MINPSEINEICKLAGLGISQREKEGARIVINALLANKNSVLHKLSPDYTHIIFELVDVMHTLDLKDVNLTVIDDGMD